MSTLITDPLSRIAGFRQPFKTYNGTITEVVVLKRYTNEDLFGVHIKTTASDGNFLTLGLFDNDTIRSFVALLDLLNLRATDIPDSVYEDGVLPLEWKGMSKDELATSVVYLSQGTSYSEENA